MMVSFRTRLFFAACAIVMIVVIVVLVMGWFRFMQFETARIDGRLCSESRRLALERFPGNEFPRLESDILGKLQLASASQLLLQVTNTQPAESYRSAHWPSADTNINSHWTESLSSRAAAPSPEARPGGPPQQTFECQFATFNFGGSQWRAARTSQRDTEALVAADLSAPKREIQNAQLTALAIIVPLALTLAATGAFLLTSMMMQPVNRLRESMRRVTPQDLEKRLATDGETREFIELTSAYNDMLDRLERSFQQASRFSADAAHELKTPLTILRGRIEQARRRPEARELHDELSAMLDEVGRLAAITRKLLLLSQADAGRLDIRYSAVNLTDTLNAMVTDIAMVVERRQFRHSIALGLVTQGDAVLLLQLLNNLISNALRYTPESGEINLIAHRKGASVCIEFSNSSLPISQAQRQRFFERFFRADEAHNRRVDGNGLGLSLAREIAKAHGGALDLAPSSHDIVSLLLTLPSA